MHLNSKIKNQKGITMITLVVTIVILIILAGVTINLLLGDNGLITRAREASNQTKVSMALERLELAKATAYMNSADGTINADSFMEAVEQENIAYQDNGTLFKEGDNQVKVIIDGEEYIVTIEDTSTSINPSGGGSGGGSTVTRPIITRVTVSNINQTSLQFTVTAGTANASGGTFKYYIRQSENSYSDTPVYSGAQNSYTFTGLSKGTSYVVKVVLSVPGYDDYSKESSLVTFETDPVPQASANIRLEYSPDLSEGWIRTNRTVTATISSSIEGYRLETRLNSGAWSSAASQTIEENGQVFEARLVRESDPTKVSKDTARYEEGKIDKQAPSGSAPSVNIQGTRAIVTMRQVDYGSSGVQLRQYAYSSTNDINTAIWETGGTSKEITGLTAEVTYYFWTRMKDGAGNETTSDVTSAISTNNIPSANEVITYSVSPAITEGTYVDGTESGLGRTLSLGFTSSQPSDVLIITSTDGTTWSAGSQNPSIRITENSKTVYAKVKKGSNESGDMYIVPVTVWWVDNTAPTNTAPDATATSTAVTITNRQQDPESSITNIEYIVKTLSSGAASSSDSWQTTATLGVDSTGAALLTGETYNVYTRATNGAGNTVISMPSQVTLSRTQVNINDYVLAAFEPSNQDTAWISGQRTVSYTLKQALPEGCKVQMRGSNVEYNSSTVSTWAEVGSLKTGKNGDTVEFRIIDNRGGTASDVLSYVERRIDTTAPTDTMPAKSGNSTGHQITVLFKQTDTESGLKTREFQIMPQPAGGTEVATPVEGKWVAISNPAINEYTFTEYNGQPLLQSTNYVIWSRATNNANLSTISIPLTATTAVEIPNIADIGEITGTENSNIWTTGPRTIGVRVKDGVTMPTGMQFAYTIVHPVNGTQETQIGNSVDITDNNVMVKFKLTDGMDHYSSDELSYKEERIDNIAPSDTAPTATVDGRVITIRFNQTDTGGSGIKSKYYKKQKADLGDEVEDTDWTEFTTETTSTSGLSRTIYNVFTKTVDNAGNATISQATQVQTEDSSLTTIATDNGPIDLSPDPADGERFVGNYIGKRVYNYNPGNDEPDTIYRLFYVDFTGYFGTEGEATIFLMAETQDETPNVTGTGIVNGASTSTDYTVAGQRAQTLSYDWWNNIRRTSGRDIDGTGLSTAEKTALYLLDSTKWTKYVDVASAQYAIGAPSVELYMSAYNQALGVQSIYGADAPNIDGTTEGSLSYEFMNVNGTAYGYKLGQVKNGSLVYNNGSDGNTRAGYTLDTDSLTATYSDYYRYIYAGYHGGYAVAGPSTYAPNEILGTVTNERYDFQATLTHTNGGMIQPIVAVNPDFVVSLVNDNPVTPKIKVNGVDVTLTKSNVKEYYGKEVSNFDPSEDEPGTKYRLFFVDFDGYFGTQNRIFLKAEITEAQNRIETTGTIQGANNSNVYNNATSRMQQYNSRWGIYENRGAVNRSDWTEAEKRAAHLLDTSYWTKYTTSQADYAIGAPTLEMFMKVYTQYIQGENSDYNEEIPLTYSNKGYAINGGQSMATNITADALYNDFKYLLSPWYGEYQMATPVGGSTKELFQMISEYRYGETGRIINTENAPYAPVVAMKTDFVPTIKAAPATRRITTATGATVNLTKDNISQYLGTEIVNYDPSRDEEGTKYRLFYVDFDGYFGEPNTMYLKAEITEEQGNNATTGTKQGANISDTYANAYTKMEQYNPLWAIYHNRGKIDGDANSNGWTTAEKRDAYLLDYTKWTKYLDTANAEYAMGAPTLEMYVKAYTQYKDSRATSDQFNLTYYNNGYKIDNTTGQSAGTLTAQANDEFKYLISAWYGEYQLASPSAEDGDKKQYVVNSEYRYGTSGEIVGREYSSYAPIIVAKSSFVPQVKPAAATRRIVKKDGTTVNLTKDNVSEYLGMEVSNYNPTMDETDTKYRLFYVDFDGYFGEPNTIYLKAEITESQGNNTTQGTAQGASTSAAFSADTTKMERYNPLWAIYHNRGKVEAAGSSGWTQAEKRDAFLLDYSRWTKYLDTNQANYAFGAPTLEMYVKSYTQYKNANATSDLFTLTYSNNGYKINGGNELAAGTLQADFDDGYKYLISSWFGEYQLATPSAQDGDKNQFYINSEYRYGTTGEISYVETAPYAPLIVTKADYIPQLKKDAAAPKIRTGSSNGDIVTLTKENVAQYLGMEVTDYAPSGAELGTKYRLFYVDFDGIFGKENAIYLKAEITNPQNNNANQGAYTSNNPATTSTLMEKYNPVWAIYNNRGKVARTSWNNAELISGNYLTPGNWTKYLDSNKAYMAMGSPTVDMWMYALAQYNGNWNAANYIYNNAGYKVKGGSESYGTSMSGNIQDTNTASQSGMFQYFLSSYYGGFALASPSAASANQIYAVDSETKYAGTGKVVSADSAPNAPVIMVNNTKYIPSVENTFIPNTPRILIDSEPVTLTRENVRDYYGKRVYNYTTHEDQGTIIYRLFFVDFDGRFGPVNTVYLKAQQVRDTSGDYISINNPGTTRNSTSLVELMNPQWAVYSNRGNATTWNPNEQYANWINDPVNWTDYLDGEITAGSALRDIIGYKYNETTSTAITPIQTDKAMYAIGGPSVEMLKEVYNQIYGTDATKAMSTKYAGGTGKGYQVKIGSGNFGDSTATNSIKDLLDSNFMWMEYLGATYNLNYNLGSPSSTNANNLMVLTTDSDNGEYGHIANANPTTADHTYYSPIVALQPNFMPDITLHEADAPYVNFGDTEVRLTKDNVKYYYGRKVTNYDANGKTYRLFFVDFDAKYGDRNRVYLKADWEENQTVTLKDTYGTANNKMWDLNPQLYQTRLLNVENLNEKYTAYLNDIDQLEWKKYVSKDDTGGKAVAEWAVGGPSIEMYVDSYNQKYGEGILTTEYNTTGKANTLSKNGAYASSNYGYKIKDLTMNASGRETAVRSVLDDDMYNYRGTTGANYLIASPHYTNTYYKEERGLKGTYDGKFLPDTDYYMYKFDPTGNTASLRFTATHKCPGSRTWEIMINWFPQYDSYYMMQENDWYNNLQIDNYKNSWQTYLRNGQYWNAGGYAYYMNGYSWFYGNDTGEVTNGRYMPSVRNYSSYASNWYIYYGAVYSASHQTSYAPTNNYGTYTSTFSYTSYSTTTHQAQYDLNYRNKTAWNISFGWGESSNSLNYTNNGVYDKFVDGTSYGTSSSSDTSTTMYSYSNEGNKGKVTTKRDGVYIGSNRLNSNVTNTYWSKTNKQVEDPDQRPGATKVFTNKKKLYFCKPAWSNPNNYGWPSTANWTDSYPDDPWFNQTTNYVGRLCPTMVTCYQTVDQCRASSGYTAFVNGAGNHNLLTDVTDAFKTFNDSGYGDRFDSPDKGLMLIAKGGTAERISSTLADGANIDEVVRINQKNSDNLALNQHEDAIELTGQLKYDITPLVAMEIGTQIDLEGESQPVELSVNGARGIYVTEANVGQYYGMKVNNYTGGTGRGLTYRLFYIDFENKYGYGKNSIWLKCDPVGDAISWGSGARDTNDSTLTMLTRTMTLWMNKDSSYRDEPAQGKAAINAKVSSGGLALSEKGTSWLVDTQISYPDISHDYTDLATNRNTWVAEAIAAAPIEMFIDSYNASHRYRGKTLGYRYDTNGYTVRNQVVTGQDDGGNNIYGTSQWGTSTSTGAIEDTTGMYNPGAGEVVYLAGTVQGHEEAIYAIEGGSTTATIKPITNANANSAKITPVVLLDSSITTKIPELVSN